MTGMPAPARNVPITRPYFTEGMIDDILDDLRKVLSSGKLAPGEYASQLEQEFAAFCGTNHAVTVNSATTGLQIALRYFGVRDAEVLVPAASFLTDVSTVLFEGGTPVLVDVDPETMAVTPDLLEKRRTPRSRGIVWVHLTGAISPAHAAIRDYAKTSGLFLIEDASHAHGAEIGSRLAGSLGDVGVFSFYPTKVMTVGAGGILTTNDPELTRFARQLRMFGKDEETGEILHLGNDWFLDDIRSCLGVHQLRGLPENLAKRRTIARHYYGRLANQPGIRLIDLPADSRPTWYQFPVFLAEGIDHAAVTREMSGAGVQAKRIYKPVHSETVFAGFDSGHTPNAERMLDRSLCLPMFADLAADDVDRVCEALIRAVRQQR
jgi:dTDP-4-amino-4,6-dideoxygalactose transaminase